jgi:RHS repeat-associated protein
LTDVVVKNASGTVLSSQHNTYDVFDRRIGVATTINGVTTQMWTVYDGANTYADFDGNGNLTNRYMYGLAIDQLFGKMDASGNTRWYLTDILGSVRQIANPTGGVLDTVNYDSFGNILSESSPGNGDRFKFTGRELDSIDGQYYYRARELDPGTGRFASADPLGFGGGDVNWFRYVSNTPVDSIDPLGLWQSKVTPGSSPYDTEFKERDDRNDAVFKNFDDIVSQSPDKKLADKARNALEKLLKIAGETHPDFNDIPKVCDKWCDRVLEQWEDELTPAEKEAKAKWLVVNKYNWQHRLSTMHHVTILVMVRAEFVIGHQALRVHLDDGWGRPMGIFPGYPGTPLSDAELRQKHDSSEGQPPPPGLPPIQVTDEDRENARKEGTPVPPKN